MKTYAVYGLYKGDTFIDVGTVPEMAKRLGIKPDSLRIRCSPSYRKRFKYKGRYTLVKIGIDGKI